MLSRIFALAPRMARLSVFLVLVFAGLYFLLGKAIRAQVDRSLLDLGAGLEQLERAGPRGGPRIVELNGVRLRFASEGTGEDVGEVLDRAERSCAPSSDGPRLRGEDGERGFVACFVPAERVIGEVRQVEPSYRYMYAHRSGTRTVVISVAAENGGDLKSILPERGDAPGFDAPGIPRPPGSRRILSAREDGAPQQMTLYQTTGGDPGQLEAWYRKTLPRLGWRPLDGARRPNGPRVLVIDRAGTLAALVFDDSSPGGASVAILTSL